MSIDFFKKEGQSLLSWNSFGFRVSLFMLLDSPDCFAIGRVVDVSFTIVTVHFGILFSFAYSYTTGNNILLSTPRTEAVPFVPQIFSSFPNG
jgi:hypothetical protein